MLAEMERKKQEQEEDEQRKKVSLIWNGLGIVGLEWR